MKQPYAFHFGVGTCRGEMREVPGGSALSTFHLLPFTSARPSRRAFTLIELMGVMAIIGILSAVLLPSLISRIEDANTTKEDANLEEIARALVAGIKASGTIPNPNRTPYNTGTGGGWGDIAENFTTLIDDTPDPGTLHYVFPEQDQSARRVYLNDQFITYLVAATGGAVSGVFQTPAAGWPEQAAGLNLANIPLRMYIVSGSKKDLFLNCGENQATAPPQPTPGYGTGLITDLQNWVKIADGPTDPVPGTIPVPDSIAQWGVAYAGGGNYHTRGEFLHVKVVDLRPLFCQVTLIDTAAPENIAGFNIAVAGGGYAPNTAVMVAYLNNNITFNSDGTGNLPAQIAAFSQIASYNARHLAIPATAIPPAPPGTATYATPVSPNAPTYDLIAVVGPGAGGFLPSPDPGAAALGLADDHNQTQTFYVLKGQAINLFNGAGALDKSIVIQSDVQYKYYNNTWTRVD